MQADRADPADVRGRGPLSRQLLVLRTRCHSDAVNADVIAMTAKAAVSGRRRWADRPVV
jgi:hypothetical protein